MIIPHDSKKSYLMTHPYFNIICHWPGTKDNRLVTFTIKLTVLTAVASRKDRILFPHTCTQNGHEDNKNHTLLFGKIQVGRKWSPQYWANLEKCSPLKVNNKVNQWSRWAFVTYITLWFCFYDERCKSIRLRSPVGRNVWLHTSQGLHTSGFPRTCWG